MVQPQWEPAELRNSMAEGVPPCPYASRFQAQKELIIPFLIIQLEKVNLETPLEGKRSSFLCGEGHPLIVQDPPMLPSRAICFTQPLDLNVDLTQSHLNTYRETEVRPAVWWDWQRKWTITLEHFLDLDFASLHSVSVSRKGSIQESGGYCWLCFQSIRFRIWPSRHAKHPSGGGRRYVLRSSVGSVVQPVEPL